MRAAARGDLLRHARRVVADQFLAGLGQVEGCEELVGALAATEASRPWSMPTWTRKSGPESRSRRRIPSGMTPRRHVLLGSRPHVDAVHVGGATVRGEQACGHGQRRCLTGAVRTDDPVEGSGGNIEGQVGDGDEVAINLDEASDRQCDIFPDGGRRVPRGRRAANRTRDTPSRIEIPAHFTRDTRQCREVLR